MVVPLPTNMANVIDMLIYANTATGGMFWIFGWIAIFSISFGTLKYNNTWEDSFAGASFFAGVIGTLMGVASLLNNYVVVISIIMAVIGGAIMIWRR